MRLIAATAFAALALAGCDATRTTADTSAIEEQIKANEARWNQAYKARDADALAAFYAEDGALATPGEPLARGSEAIRKATAGVASDPAFKLTFSPNRIQVAQSGDLAYSRGRYTMTATDPATKQPNTTGGHYLTVWQKQSDGSWKVVEDMVTPGPPIILDDQSSRASAIL
ncbi:MAG: SgcJ/EcaC family oxidoreductase [Sphingomonas sp.]|nr:SgcJ/EcaC family oxidoreductase [Sphingomonas sp.]